MSGISPVFRPPSVAGPTIGGVLWIPQQDRNPAAGGAMAPRSSRDELRAFHFFLVWERSLMATVYSVTFAVLGLVVMYSSLLVWTALILPAPVGRARARLESKPVGYAGFLLLRNPWMVALDDGLQQAAGSLQFTRFYNDAFILANCAAWPLAAPAMVGWIIGGAAFAQLFANRARALMHDDRPLLALALGAITESFAFFLPPVGWFVFLPVVTLMSIGAGLLAILRPHAHFSAHGGPVGAKSTAGREQQAYESELASS